MQKKRFGRRNFMLEVIKIMAIAAGLSVEEVNQLLASGEEIATRLDPATIQQYSIYQKSSLGKIKALKVLIEDNRKIFESEYGRITPIIEVEDPKRPGEYLRVCRVQFGRAGDIIDTCGSFYGKGGECGKQKKCGNNSCGGQRCPILNDCGTLSCSGIKCDQLIGCDDVILSITSSLFEEFKSDPYIQHLFKRFEVTTSTALADQVNDLLKTRF